MLRDGGNRGGGYGAEALMMQGGGYGYRKGGGICGLIPSPGAGHGARGEGKLDAHGWLDCSDREERMTETEGE